MNAVKIALDSGHTDLELPVIKCQVHITVLGCCLGYNIGVKKKKKSYARLVE